MVFCSQCGEENEENANFCVSCGNPITNASQSASQVSSTTSVPNSNSDYGQQNVPLVTSYLPLNDKKFTTK